MRSYLADWLLAASRKLAKLDYKSQLALVRINRLEKRMTAYDDMLERLNTATNEVAADLEELKSELSANNLSAEEAASRLEPLVSRLEDMGKDADNVDPGANTDPTTTTDPTNSPATDPTVIEVNDSGEAVDTSQDQDDVS